MSEYFRNVSESKFSLVICGQKLPFAEITDQIGLEPTSTIHEGELLSALPEVVAHEDAWFHSIQMTMPDRIDPVLQGLLGTIHENKDYLKSLADAGHRVLLRLYVRSDRATMAYRLMPETLAALVSIGLPLDVTSVSWGEFGI